MQGLIEIQKVHYNMYLHMYIHTSYTGFLTVHITFFLVDYEGISARFACGLVHHKIDLLDTQILSKIMTITSS